VSLDKNAKVALLRGTPLFAGCSKAELVELAICADELEADEGQVLTREGTPAREFFVLVEGTAAVSRKDVKVAELGAGGWFGEIALLTYRPRTATVTATSPVRALVIRDRDFRRVVETMPRIALKVLAGVAQRLERDARS
jgi:CRP/FNR family cyclic AMP-dependent transcriptional regulator